MGPLYSGPKSMYTNLIKNFNNHGTWDNSKFTSMDDVQEFNTIFNPLVCYPTTNGTIKWTFDLNWFTQQVNRVTQFANFFQQYRFTRIKDSFKIVT
ncbi:hypothetical protein CJ20_036 [Escherichia phage CJ20]|nr:hypothetical protein CJ20_036 [Escherichia phage CJ20]